MTGPLPARSAAVVVPRFPLLRSLGLFVVASLVAFGVMLLAAALMDIAAIASGQQRAIAAQFKNTGSLQLQLVLIAGYLALAATLLWRYPRITKTSLAQLGFRRLGARDWGTVAGASVLLLVARGVLDAILNATNNGKHVQAGFENFHAPNGFAMVAVVISVVFVAPFAEELLFRVVLFGSLARTMPVIWAALISATLFGLVHGDLVLFPFLAFFGFVNAIVYYRTGNIFVAILLHALNNALPIGALLLNGK